MFITLPQTIFLVGILHSCVIYKHKLYYLSFNKGLDNCNIFMTKWFKLFHLQYHNAVTNLFAVSSMLYLFFRSFSIGNSSSNFSLHVSGYSGTAGMMLLALSFFYR